MENPVTGGGQSGEPGVAPKGRRVAAGIIDLFVIPIFLGIVIGLVLINVPDLVRSLVLVAVNIGWLLFRDTVFSPGRALVGAPATGELPWQSWLRVLE